jgi:RNA polymerase sigma-70 factor, ECF subfamily
VKTHQSIVMGLCQSLGLRGPDMDDAAAEAFAAVFRALPNFKGESELSTWIYRIAYRVIVKARAKRKRQAVAPLPAEPPMSENPGPLEEAERAETAQAVWSAVEKLDEREASAVELYYRREWPLEQIADVMGCPLGTVKTLLYRARQHLRDILSVQEVADDRRF